MDFTLNKYIELLTAIQKHNVITVSEYLMNQKLDSFIILRHDVDLDINYALRMAMIEHEHNIKSTYFIRYRKNVMKPNIIKKINDLGHEIGYHYEVLSKAKGNIQKSKDIFKYELSELRKFAEIKTVTMHGSPLSRFINTDFWKYNDYIEFDLLGDAQLCIKDIHYFTDTGGKWNSSNNLKDLINGSLYAPKNIATKELIKILNNNIYSKIYINNHPERWAKGNYDFITIKIRDFYYNSGKFFLKIYNKIEL